MGAASEFSLVKRNGIFFEIDGRERQAIQRKPAQNEIFECIKLNPRIKQKQIVEMLKKHKQNVSRDIIKLLRNDYITGNSNDGYFAVTPPDYPDETDDQ